MAEAQLSELRNARAPPRGEGASRNLAFHRRTRLEAKIGGASNEVERQKWELRAAEGQGRVLKANDAPTRTWRGLAPRSKPPPVPRITRKS
jgi:hypothetical protein